MKDDTLEFLAILIFVIVISVVFNITAVSDLNKQKQLNENLTQQLNTTAQTYYIAGQLQTLGYHNATGFYGSGKLLYFEVDALGRPIYQTTTIRELCSGAKQQ